jgi:hypothetical protein
MPFNGGAVLPSMIVSCKLVPYWKNFGKCYRE